MPWLLTLALVVCGTPLLRGDDPAPQEPLSVEQQERLKERDRSLEQAGSLFRDGRLDEALAESRKVLAIEREVLGPIHPEVLDSLKIIALIQTAMGDFNGSRATFQERVELLVRVHGAEHWKVTDARLDFDYNERWARLSATDRLRLQEARQLTSQSNALYGQGKIPEAMIPAEQAAAIRKAVLGETHPDYATSLDNLAVLHRDQGDHAEAASLFRRSLTIRKDALGENHPDYAASLESLLNSLGMIAKNGQSQGNFDDSRAALQERLERMEQLHGADHWKVTDARQERADNDQLSRLTLAERQRLEEGRELAQQSVTLQSQGRIREALDPALQSVAILKGILGENHPDYARSLNILAAIYRAQGKREQAVPLCREALEIRKRVRGEGHPDYATSLNDLALLFQDQGDLVEAAGLLRQAREIRKKALGENHPAYALSLSNLATLYQAQGDLRGAVPLCREALEIWNKTLGKDHPYYATGLNNLAILYQEQGDYEQAFILHRQALEIRARTQGEDHPDYANSLNNLALLYKDRGDYVQAEPLLRLALEIHKKVLGEDHPDYANSLNNLAELYRIQGDYPQAEVLYNQALEIRKKVLGENHPDYAMSLNNLALLYKEQGDYPHAEVLLRQTLEIRKKALGENHPDFALSLNNLGMLYEAQGNYAQAGVLYRQALELIKKTRGEIHPSYATTLNNLAGLCQHQGDSARAELFHRQTLEIRKKALGENHPDFAQSLNNLALLFQEQGDFAQAAPLFEHALEIQKKALGENHPGYATILSNLALVYQGQRNYAQAEASFRLAMEIRKKTLGENHPGYAASLNNLAILYQDQGDCARALPLHLQSLEINKRALGENHPDYAIGLNNLAMLYDDQGERAQAEALYRRAVTITLRHLENSASAQSERQQLAHTARLRHFLDGYLACGSAPADAGAYDLILSWKGAVTARQRLARAARRARSGDANPEVLRLCSDLEAVSRQLALLSRATPERRQLVELPTRIRDLEERRERLEAELSQSTEAFRRLRASRGLTPAAFQQLLPEDTALVDFLEYGVPKERKEGRTRLAAFVVRREGITRVELGEVAPLDDAIAGFRRTLGRSRPVTGPNDPAVLLRQRLWEPLEESLAGARLVLLSPDGALNGLPFAALPGREDGTYLLEDVALAVLPVPQLLPDLLAKRDPAKADTPPSLLALGDADFDAGLQGVQPAAAEPESTTGWHRRRAGEPRQWTRLEGTRGEVLAIADTFRAAVPRGKLAVLREANATAAALRHQAAEFEYLHLATHGYFADPSVEPATVARESRGNEGLNEGVIGHDPGLLSGLVFAGANHPVDGEDGVLTALEVSELELSRVELAVLSACETGLGEVAGGEGVLGLQRAFQVAGARTLVTSLWKVDDQATRQLMERLYEGYWKNGLGAQEALREAQLWLLREGVKRGLVRQEEGSKAGARTPPLFWGAFVLSGDWR